MKGCYQGFFILLHGSPALRSSSEMPQRKIRWHPPGLSNRSGRYWFLNLWTSSFLPEKDVSRLCPPHAALHWPLRRRDSGRTEGRASFLFSLEFFLFSRELRLPFFRSLFLQYRISLSPPPPLNLPQWQDTSPPRDF